MENITPELVTEPGELYAGVRSSETDRERANVVGTAFVFTIVTFLTVLTKATEQPWAARSGAASQANRSLKSDIDAIEAAQVDRGVAATIEQNASAAVAWRSENCPSGSGREFGACAARGGLVLQERAGETHLVAVAFDVTVVSERGETELTVVVRLGSGER